MSEQWIGVDLDGTLAVWEDWTPWNVIGKPIQPMVDRVRAWVWQGREVRIMTARVTPHDGEVRVCRLTGVEFTTLEMREVIHEYLLQLGLPMLPVTCIKDVDMVELWDDRVVQVVTNTGLSLAESHLAEMTALRGAP